MVVPDLDSSMLGGVNSLSELIVKVNACPASLGELGPWPILACLIGCASHPFEGKGGETVGRTADGIRQWRIFMSLGNHERTLMDTNAEEPVGRGIRSSSFKL